MMKVSYLIAMISKHYITVVYFLYSFLNSDRMNYFEGIPLFSKHVCNMTCTMFEYAYLSLLKV